MEKSKIVAAAGAQDGTQPPQTGQVTIKVLQWLSWADQDYVAARGLLLSGSLVQGSAFSTTAIEKYLKAILTLRSSKISRTHDVVKLYEQAKSVGNIPPLNESYLRTLVKAYELRYPDDLKEAFNISLTQTQLLAELDASVYAIRKPFEFQKVDGRPVETRLDSLLKVGDSRVTDRNTAFTQFDRMTLFEGESYCYELRVLSGGEIIEADYRAHVSDSANFDAEGLKPAQANDSDKP
jgi:HEPN domain-containing protein